MANIQDGVYNATISSAGVYEKNGLKLELHLTLCDEHGSAYTQTGTDGREYPIEKRMYYTLVSDQGAVNTKVMDFIRAWAKGWDGSDPFWFCDSANTAAIGMVEVTLKTEPAWNDPTKSYQNVKFINELGHSTRFGGGAKTAVQSGDKASIMAKYGAKFKAALGSTIKPVSAASIAKPAPSAPKAPTRPAPAPSSPQAKTPSAQPMYYKPGLEGQGKLWDEFCDNNGGASQEELSTKWFQAIDKVSPGKDQEDFTSEEWQKVSGELNILPF